MTITGTGFTGATAVDFGSERGDQRERRLGHRDHCRFTRWDRHGRRDRDHPVGPLRPTSPADQFTYTTLAPVVNSVAPTLGPTAGGTPVTITGTDFSGATAVDFGSNAGDRSPSTRHLDHRDLAGRAAGTVDVTVTTPGGTLRPIRRGDQFTYTVAAPPGPPTNLAATLGVGQATLSWTAPNNNGQRHHLLHGGRAPTTRRRRRSLRSPSPAARRRPTPI